MWNEYGYLLKTYVSLFLFAIKRMEASQEDMLSLLFVLRALFLYILGFKGELKTPTSRVLVTSREILRSFTYGFLKTHFAYQFSLKRILPRDSVFPLIIDVGANISDFALAMRNHAGKIVALEPAEENFLAMKANLRINRAENILPIRAAAHDKEEEVFLEGNSSDMYITKAMKGQSAKGIPLDILTRKLGIQAISILKIDVQGHEMKVLQGMRRLLQDKLVKLIILETHLKRQVSVENIVSFVQTFDYRLVYNDDYLFDQPHLYFMPNCSERELDAM